MKDEVVLTAVTVEDSESAEVEEAPETVLQALSVLQEYLDKYESPKTPLQTPEGIKRSCVYYKRFYDVHKSINEVALKPLKKRQNEAVERLGLPKTNPTDLVRLQLRNTGYPEKSLADIQRELAEGNPVLMDFLAEAEKKYQAQPTDKKTVIVYWNK